MKSARVACTGTSTPMRSTFVVLFASSAWSAATSVAVGPTTVRRLRAESVAWVLKDAESESAGEGEGQVGAGVAGAAPCGVV